MLIVGPYTPLCFPLDHLSQGQHLSFCPTPTHLFMDQPKDVALHPGLLAQGVGFHLLCHLHQPQGLLRSPCGATIAGSVTDHFSSPGSLSSKREAALCPLAGSEGRNLSPTLPLIWRVDSGSVSLSFLICEVGLMITASQLS